MAIRNKTKKRNEWERIKTEKRNNSSKQKTIATNKKESAKKSEPRNSNFQLLGFCLDFRSSFGFLFILLLFSSIWLYFFYSILRGNKIKIPFLLYYFFSHLCFLFIQFTVKMYCKGSRYLWGNGRKDNRRGNLKW